ncbi:MAG: 3D-(3,5/4)-trihydroxycyclohexane-1,2-dione acylhydrolase (decyclizing) [Rhodospirillum sp.]|nr:3D-(3,5/4)-trihydroxycyclohexane-1,2-dione acylhydrolase (decyclizing) [Rhodospirillum sp.]MCF8491586.1 3D-(3,5/4)-trihydroxycyclohexane-1,2-dione acylhydrolase (decyclizing) [Rhodospirillum sp.]MCF8500926.1 3D-(3,5/4)-trihydroxycyclohexane-1,2-dione acylhydrolase (decyclizing) [Rhodospirillum sp.]
MTGFEKTRRLTMAQAVALFLSRQRTVIDGEALPLFGGVWAIFGHGNVSGFGEALYPLRDVLPTFRAHNEQGMAHAAVAYAKATFRRRMMACTTSIGPGALNMVTAAAVAHVNRLPLLLLPGDVFANRIPDPVLQQVEDFGDGTATVNDAFRSVSRYFDRITRPEQIIPALRRAMAVLTDPADCGPVTLALCQDVQAEAFDYPESVFAEKIWIPRRPRADTTEIAAAVEALRTARKPVIIGGGGVLYSEAGETLGAFAAKRGIPVLETQAGKSALPHSHPLNMGAVGVTGTSASNDLVVQADVVLAVGSRLQDFTTGSWSVFENPEMVLVALNTQPFDATKRAALPVVADAKVGLEDIDTALGDWSAPATWTAEAKAGKARWAEAADAATMPTNAERPSDAQVIGAVQRALGPEVIGVCAAGGLPGELHKLWRAEIPGGYHLEYGFSCMGYEIAGGMGVKMARPDKEVVVMVGDGSYMMLNSELATAAMLNLKITVVLLDNGGFGCINRLQMACGGANFNNLLEDARQEIIPTIDFVQHAAAMGATAEKVSSVGDLEAALLRARETEGPSFILIDTHPLITTEAGGFWWDVAVPEVSEREDVRTARAAYVQRRDKQRVG